MLGLVTTTTAVTQSQSTPAMPRLLTEFAVNHPAFLDVSMQFGRSGPSLSITTFGVTNPTDDIYVVRGIDKLAASEGKGEVKVEVLATDTVWPNQANIVKNGSQVLTADGFFVSSKKSTGSVEIFDVSRFPLIKKTKVSEDRKANFYHRAFYMDVDKDGVSDIVAARSYKSFNPLAKPEGEIMWFKPPSSTSGTWTTHYLTTPQGLGPGVGFEQADLDGDGKMEFVAAQFFTAKALSVWACENSKWSECENGEGVSSYIIDEVGDSFFNVQWIDLNNDGKKDLLATTNTANGKGAVYAYELKGDFRNGPAAWIKHTLATGYKPLKIFPPGQGSPGTAHAFKVQDNSDDKPAILVSADDGGWVDILFAVSTNATDWTYSQNRLTTSTGTVGTVSPPMDVTGSGKKVFFVPLYAESKVQMYMFD